MPLSIPAIARNQAAKNAAARPDRPIRPTRATASGRVDGRSNRTRAPSCAHSRLCEELRLSATDGTGAPGGT